MKLTFRTILILMGIRSIYSMHPADFCYVSTAECVNKNSCPTQKCPEQYPFNSEIGLCSIDKSTYEKFSTWSFLVRQLKAKDLIQRNLDPFLKFTNRIKECDWFLKFNAENACYKNQICQAESKPLVKDMFFLKLNHCACKNKYSYECGNSYCTSNHDSCVSLIINENNSKLMAKIEKCKNIKKN